MDTDSEAKDEERPSDEVDDLEPEPDDAEQVKGGTSVSNVLKTRHDTAKNSISNVR